MQCRLCLSEVGALRKSHIIPECLYKEVYDEKHRFASISNGNYQNLKIEQLGYREKLLCGGCENKLSRWENDTKRHFVDISKGSSNVLTISKISERYRLVEGIYHYSFKMCMLSILWRMSISSHEIFCGYDLGPYEERLRRIIYQELSLSTFDYPIFVKEVSLNGTHYPDLITCIGKGRIGDHISQSFIVYGYLIDIIVSKSSLNMKYEALVLSDKNRLVIGKVEHGKLPHDRGLLERFKQDDVKKFYQ